MCQVCHGNDTFIVIDGKSICSDDVSYMEHPTCKEIYTKKYVCNFCESEKSTLNEYCYIVENVNDKNKYTSYIYLCETCFKPYVDMYKENRDSKKNEFKKVSDYKHGHICYLVSKDTENSTSENAEHDKFICNKCQKIDLINNGIFICDSMNVCNECVQLYE